MNYIVCGRYLKDIRMQAFLKGWRKLSHAKFINMSMQILDWKGENKPLALVPESVGDYGPGVLSKTPAGYC